MSSNPSEAYVSNSSPRYEPHPAPLWDLPQALFVVDEDGIMRLLNPQAEELAEDSHLHAVHFDPQMFQRGWF